MRLEIKDLHVHYGKIEAIKGISVVVNEGEIVTLIGSNGAGKTTILKTISQILQQTEGEIYFLGDEISKYEPHHIVHLGVSHVPEGRRVFPQLTVLENLEMGAYKRNDKEGIKDDLAIVFKRFPRLEERKHQSGGTLSGGEQQRIAIARALLNSPELILADEPTGNLDPQTSVEVMEVLQEISKQGNTILMATHDYALLLKYPSKTLKCENSQLFEVVQKTV